MYQAANQMDEKADAGDHAQHGDGQTVEVQTEVDVEIAHGDPLPQRLDVRIATVGAPEDHDQRGDQRGQADRGGPDGAGRVVGHAREQGERNSAGQGKDQGQN